MSTVATIDSRKRQPILPNSILGTLIFVGTEVMFFAALISAFVVIRAATGADSWAPPEGVYLPVTATAFNTLVLFISGVMLYVATRALGQGEHTKAQSYLLRAIILGGAFVGFQGYEWVNLINFGMTMKSGIFGATFYLIIGSHGLHALGAILVMAYLYFKLYRHQLRVTALQAMQIFWFFVVGVWPLLYGLVYF